MLSFGKIPANCPTCKDMHAHRPTTQSWNDLRNKNHRKFYSPLELVQGYPGYSPIRNYLYKAVSAKWLWTVTFSCHFIGLRFIAAVSKCFPKWFRIWSSLFRILGVTEKSGQFLNFQEARLDKRFHLRSLSGTCQTDRKLNKLELLYMVSKSAADGLLREGNTNLTGQVIVCYIAQSNRCLFQRENKRRSACEVNIV